MTIKEEIKKQKRLLSSKYKVVRKNAKGMLKNYEETHPRKYKEVMED